MVRVRTSTSVHKANIALDLWKYSFVKAGISASFGNVFNLEPFKKIASVLLRSREGEGVFPRLDSLQL